MVKNPLRILVDGTPQGREQKERSSVPKAALRSWGRRQRQSDLNSVAIHPPLPVVWGKPRNQQSGGRNSEKEEDSPGRSQVSVRNEKSSSKGVKE